MTGGREKPLSGELTKSQVNRLGDRLRKGEPLATDLEMLDAYRRSFDSAYQLVNQTLRNLGRGPSGRIKTTVSIVEKLKRESIRLSRLQDIAGCRVIAWDVADQDRVVDLVRGSFQEVTVIDRRQKDSHGYRAVHLVVDVTDRLVEIQIRTDLQHLWAMWSEALADVLDQSIKYGGGPVEIQKSLTFESEKIALLESQEYALAPSLKAFEEGKLQLPELQDLHLGSLCRLSFSLRNARTAMWQI